VWIDSRLLGVYDAGRSGTGGGCGDGGVLRLLFIVSLDLSMFSAL